MERGEKVKWRGERRWDGEGREGGMERGEKVRWRGERRRDGEGREGEMERGRWRCGGGEG